MYITAILPVCVSSQSPLFHKVYLYLFVSDSTACISYLMWNTVPCVLWL